MRLLRPNRVIWMAVGAALAYFFDPDNGPARRAKVADMLAERRQTGESTTTASPLEAVRSPSPYESPAPAAVGGTNAGNLDH